MVSNPELMVLMQNAKLQEIMKKVRLLCNPIHRGWAFCALEVFA